jgi:site-specific recombinase XerD
VQDRTGVYLPERMNPPASATLSQLVQVFLDEYLPHRRALSPRTVESYRDALRLLLEHLEAQIGRSSAHIALSDCTSQRIQSFLDHLEFERHNSVHSRNLRLAAVRTFLRFAADSGASPAAIESALRVPAKRFARPKPQFLSHAQMCAIIGGSDNSWIGRRDHALLSLLYDTAATVSEIIRLRLEHIDLDGDPHALLRSSRRARSVPLRPATVAALRAWLVLNPSRAPEAALFPNQRGAAMTATCVRRRLALAVARAALVDPELRQRRVSPRLVRHTAAMHLLQCGTDLGLISHWLGHDTPATMHNHARAYRMLGEQSGLPCADALSSLPGRARERGTRGFGVDAPERSP